MEESKREILERNRVLLVENIIVTDEFYQLLRSECILPETMVKDIQSGKTPHERNSVLLDRLQLRAGNSYRKFRHLLYLTGHRFLTDHLYTEDCETKILRPEDLFARFPSVFDHISDDTKSRLLRYLESKVKEKSLINDWIKTGPDRMEFLESKKSSFNTEKDLSRRLEDKTKRVLQLEDANVQLREEIKKQNKEIARLSKDIADNKQSMKEDLAKQSRFNAANNSSIIQLRDRFESFNERVKVLNVYIRTFLNSADTSMVAIDDDQENTKMSFLERNVKKLTQVARMNMETSSSSVNEKEVVMSMLQTSASHSKDSLSDIVHQYVRKEEKSKQALAKEVDGILDMLRGNKFTAKTAAKPKPEMKWLRSQIAVIREEIEHLKKKLEWKDHQITELIEETAAIKEKQQQTQQPQQQQQQQQPLQQQQQQQHPQQALSLTFPRLVDKHSAESPDSMKEMEKVYQQLDKYIDETKPPQRRGRRGSLAEVNLEPITSQEWDAYATGRRNSKIDSSDLDILGSRSYGNLKSSSANDLKSSSFKDMRIADSKENGEPTVHAEDILNYKEVGNRRPALQDYLPPFRREGRRPSLAELVTIYEMSTDIRIPDCGVEVE